MSSGWDEGAERFADAWEQTDTGRRSSSASARRAASGNGRAPHPDDPTMRTPALDPELRRELDLAAALREASRSVSGPSADESARMRASLMAAIGGAPADLDDEESREGRLLGGTGSAGSRGAGRAGSTSRAGRTRSRPATETSTAAGPGRGARRRTRSGRILSNVVTGACAVLLLGALTVVLSRGALPGEMLYGVKRSSESVEMGLTGGQEAKGRKHLDFAALRLSEVGQLVERGSTTAAGSGPVAAGLDPADAALVSENLRDFNEQAQAGSRLMLPLTGQPGGPTRGELAQWAQERSTQLDTLSPSLSGDDRVAASSSKQLLTRLSSRFTDLDKRRSCPEVSTGSDELGPLPSSARCAGLDEPRTDRVPASRTTTSPTTTTTRESTSTDEDETSSTERSTTSSSTTTSEPDTTTSERRTPDPVQVPLPVPLMPKVDVPPIIPGLPGLSLG